VEVPSADDRSPDGAQPRSCDPTHNQRSGSGAGCLEFQVNVVAGRRTRRPRPGAAIDGDGEFLVVRQSNLQDGNEYGLVLSRP
jgi:hypothetical protein